LKSTKVPWALWGHSGGGIWSDVMTALHPDRVIAVWMRSGSALCFSRIRNSYAPMFHSRCMRFDDDESGREGKPKLNSDAPDNRTEVEK